MYRKLYLEGALSNKFGSSFSIEADSVADAVKCLECNFPELRAYLIKCHEEGVGFTVNVAGEDLEDEVELLLPITKGDIVISPVPAGSKSGGSKILAAIALVLIAVYAPQVLTTTGSGFGQFAGQQVTYQTALGAAIGSSTAKLVLYSMAINLALTGISQLMAPDPATDSDQEVSYLFNGSEQNIIEGDPVPVLYGRLRVPGQPVNFEVTGKRVRTRASAFNPFGASLGNSAVGFIAGPDGADVEYSIE
jgi:predicted phage tail protein